MLDLREAGFNYERACLTSSVCFQIRKILLHSESLGLVLTGEPWCINVVPGPNELQVLFKRI